MGCEGAGREARSLVTGQERNRRQLSANEELKEKKAAALRLSFF